MSRLCEAVGDEPVLKLQVTGANTPLAALLDASEWKDRSWKMFAINRTIFSIPSHDFTV